MAADYLTKLHFTDLFGGRWDAYGDAGAEPKAVRKHLTSKEWDWHLADGPNGNRPLGIYPLLDNLTVKWGCTDLDTGEEAIIQARNIQTVLRHLGVTSWVERSRSKGFHVWVFASEAVPAEHMRNMLLFAHEIAGVPAKEINPKQTTLGHTEHGLGNWVRLPYPGGVSTNLRQCVLDPTGAPLTLNEFVDDAWEQRVSPAQIAEVAAMYQPPPPPKTIALTGSYEGELEPLRRKLGGLANRIFIEGPLQARNGKAGRDRSSALFRLAFLMASEGELDPSQAYAVLADADARWGKYHDRADGEQQLRRIIETAWERAE